MSKSYNHLKILTKQQIIDYLKENVWHNEPDKKEVQMFLWEEKAKANGRAMDDYTADSVAREDLARRIDDLAGQFNKSDQPSSVKLKLLKQRDDLIKELKSKHKVMDDLIKESNKIDQFYNSIHSN